MSVLVAFLYDDTKHIHIAYIGFEVEVWSSEASLVPSWGSQWGELAHQWQDM